MTIAARTHERNPPMLTDAYIYSLRAHSTSPEDPLHNFEAQAMMSCGIESNSESYSYFTACFGGLSGAVPFSGAILPQTISPVDLWPVVPYGNTEDSFPNYSLCKRTKHAAGGKDPSSPGHQER